MASNPDAPREAPPTHRKVSWRSPEILGELVLLAVVAILIVVYFRRLDLCESVFGDFSVLGARACVPIGRFVSVAAGQWLPMIIIGAAIPLWIIRLGYVLRRRKAIEQGMIMDLGFRLGEDPQGERRRAALYFGTLVALILLIWLVGFHIGLPALGRRLYAAVDARQVALRARGGAGVRGVHHRHPRPRARHLLVRAAPLPLDRRRLPLRRVVHPRVLAAGRLRRPVRSTLSRRVRGVLSPYRERGMPALVRLCIWGAGFPPTRE